MTLAANPDWPGNTSDLQQAGDIELAPKKASRQILRHEIEEGLDALGRPALGNTLGGVVFVAFVRYGLARPEAQAA